VTVVVEKDINYFSLAPTSARTRPNWWASLLPGAVQSVWTSLAMARQLCSGAVIGRTGALTATMLGAGNSSYKVLLGDSSHQLRTTVYRT